MPTMIDYYRSMTTRDWSQFLYAVGSTLVVGSVVLYAVFRWLQRVVGPPPAHQKDNVAAAKKRSSGPTTVVRASTTGSNAGGATNAVEDVVVVEGEAAAPRERRRIPRAAQATLVERGNRLIADKEFKEALTCFLSILFASVEGDEKVLPTQLTECLRGVGQCYMGMGQPEVAVTFFQAERRVFEEMVVQAARGPTAPGGVGPERSIIASLLGGGKKSTATLPKRCYTLSEVADACAKLGHDDIAVAYRLKAAALRQRMSGEPLDPESEEAALLAQSLHAYQTKYGKDTGGGGGAASSNNRSKSSHMVSAEADASAAREELERELRRRVAEGAAATTAVGIGSGVDIGGVGALPTEVAPQLPSLPAAPGAIREEVEE